MHVSSKPDSTQRSFLVTLLIATLLHGLLLLQWHFEWQPFASQLQQNKVQNGLQLVLMPPAKAVSIPQKTSTRPTTEQPRPQVHQPAPQPKLASKPSLPQQEQSEESAPEPEEPVMAQAEEGPPPAASSDNVIRENYIASLLAHIERHKYYPRNARRRGITGKVNIKLQIESDGSVSTLETSGTYRILSLAARQSIESALPMPHISQGVNYPIMLSFDMRYDIL